MRKITGITALAAAGLMLGAKAAGLHFNFTESAPAGVWMVWPVVHGSLWKGRIISVCPPDVPAVRKMTDHLAHGNCSGTNVAPLLKAIGAVEGDTVTIRTGEPVRVNGRMLPNTAAKHGSLAWQDGEYAVRPYEVWVFSTYSNKSFDSRYFGPVNVINIQGGAYPLIVSGNNQNMRLGL